MPNRPPRPRAVLGALFVGLVLVACSSSPYESPALVRLAPIVELDRANVERAGVGLELAAVRDAAAREGMSVAIGASRGVDDLSVETISERGVRRVFAMLDGDDCLFAVVDTAAKPPVVYWLLVADVYKAVEIVPSAACSASAFFGIDLSGRSLSLDSANPTRLG
jgi:hypothetical protein